MVSVIEGFHCIYFHLQLATLMRTAPCYPTLTIHRTQGHPPVEAWGTRDGMPCHTRHTGSVFPGCPSLRTRCTHSACISASGCPYTSCSRVSSSGLPPPPPPHHTAHSALMSSWSRYGISHWWTWSSPPERRLCPAWGGEITNSQ